MAALTNLIPWIVASVLTVALAAGVALLILGRGRRVGTEPHCRKCGYNLTGLTAERCPECGRAATGQNVVIGTRRRRWRLLAPGLVLLLLGLAGAGGRLIDSVRGVNWRTYLPTSALAWMSQNEDSAAVTELANRLSAGDTTPQPLLPLVPLALDKHGVRPRVDSTWAWGALLASLERAGALTVADIEQFHEQSVNFEARFRRQVRVSDQFELYLSLFVCGPSNVGCSIEHGLARFGNQIEQEFTLSWQAPGNGLGIGLHPDLSGLTPGKYPIEVQAEKVFTGPRFTREFRLSDELEILPPDAPEPIKLVKDAQIAKKLSEIMSIDLSPDMAAMLSGLDDPANWIVLGTTLKESVPMDLAFVLFGRVGDREIEMGTVTFRPAPGRVVHGNCFHRPCADGESFIPILRSSIKAARERPDIVEIWDGELIFPPIRLAPAAPATSSAPSPNP
jgi:hypothetical protein